ncbi:LOW QUALITY PROTEIN: synapsin [Glossina fuscipes fuscipes]
MEVHRGDSRIPRMFRPDFVLIRQPPRDGANDYRSTILGLKYGGVPSINSLNSVYQFQDKPWVFAHLQQLQRRLGKDVFPLIEQTFFPSPKYLLNWTKFPCVLKAGHCHGGMATARFENQSALQDAAGLVTGTGSEGHCYCTIEPYIDAKFDIHIQKIGNNYKAFMRKSITGNWKTNQGSAMLEQITLTDKYKSWVDEVSEMFGGMEVCGLSLVVGRDGREHIIKASDSTFALMGDTQEDDRRQIADLVTSRMQNVCRPGAGQIQGKITARSSVSSLTGSPTDESGAPPPAPAGPRPAPMGGPPPIPERTSPAVGSIGRLTSRSSISEVPEETTATAAAPASVAPSTGNLTRRDSQTSQASSISSASRTSQRAPQSQSSVVEDAEDTMKNLRKTFAGIFGDMELANKKRGRTASESGSTNTSGIGSISVGGITSAGSNFLGKQFSFASGKTSAPTSAVGDASITSSPPNTNQSSEKPFDTRSDTSSTSTLTAGSVSSSSKPSSSVLDTYEQENSKYKPVTNFEPQERVNPFDKGVLKTSATSNTIGSASTTSSSTISSSSISSRINARATAMKSPPPPSRPPPPPPQSASIATNSSATIQSSSASNKDKTSYLYGSSTSIETITRMDTNTTTGTGSMATATTSIGVSCYTENQKNITDNDPERRNKTTFAANTTAARSASVYSAPAAVNTSATATAGDDAQSTAATSNGYNATTDIPSYTRPSYSRSESNDSKGQSDLDIIFGGGTKYNRASSDAELIFGTPLSYKSDRFGSSKSMSVASDNSYGYNPGSNATTMGGGNAYKIYEGIQNAAFTDFVDSPASQIKSKIDKKLSGITDDEDDLDLK